MAVAAETSFPNWFISGDTVRVTISDPKFPSSGWGLQVVLQNGNATKSFNATAGSNNAFDLVISSTNSAEIVPGFYQASYVYTETGNGDRKTGDRVDATTVYANPTGTYEKSIARQTLEAMEIAYKSLASGGNATVNFNGQSFTKRNLKGFADAIDRQRAIVAAEDASRLKNGGRLGRILHPL